MKKTLFMVYLFVGIVICGWYSLAAANRWKSPSWGGSSYRGSGGYYGGRSLGGSWGGGK